MQGTVEIINGDHDPPFPFMIVNRFGMHVDLSKVQGQLWDAPTVAKIEWGLLTLEKKPFGRVTLKNGQTRTFFSQDLMTPYVNEFFLEYERRGHGAAGPGLARVRHTQTR
jgi:hypothetical protein